MSNVDRSKLFVQPLLPIGIGGFGTSCITVLGSAVNALLTDVGVNWVTPLSVDFVNASDPVPPGLSDRYKVQSIPDGNKIELDIEPLRDLAQSDNNSPQFEPVWKLCPRSVLTRALSQQAGQVPSIGRAALWYRLQEFAMIVEAKLRELAPAGEVLTRASRCGFRADQINQFVEIWLVCGTGGGTGGGGCLLSAVVTTAIARRLGIPYRLSAALALNYRASQQDADADRRAALSEQLARDIEAVQQAGSVLSVTGYNGQQFKAPTPLFHRVLLFEGHGRLHGDAGAMAISVGESLAYRATMMAARKFSLGGEQNVLQRLRED